MCPYEYKWDSTKPISDRTHNCEDGLILNYLPLMPYRDLCPVYSIHAFAFSHYFFMYRKTMKIQSIIKFHIRIEGIWFYQLLYYWYIHIYIFIQISIYMRSSKRKYDMNKVGFKTESIKNIWNIPIHFVFALTHYTAAGCVVMQRLDLLYLKSNFVPIVFSLCAAHIVDHEQYTLLRVFFFTFLFFFSLRPKRSNSFSNRYLPQAKSGPIDFRSTISSLIFKHTTFTLQFVMCPFWLWDIACNRLFQPAHSTVWQAN